ncbi:UNKNOWN [Stylonychia lemnae]|uniref:Transmembrane protein n=1 Tax=Stylonychia lemnae TaxID=5949 RepID=A0A078B574_STYLE|nr:UNKNOWN [Stylonychia lemnae]|eukprot:CDW88407.1 UNKNOWN [Stylonychia lemnae]
MTDFAPQLQQQQHQLNHNQTQNNASLPEGQHSIRNQQSKILCGRYNLRTGFLVFGVLDLLQFVNYLTFWICFQSSAGGDFQFPMCYCGLVSIFLVFLPQLYGEANYIKQDHVFTRQQLKSQFCLRIFTAFILSFIVVALTVLSALLRRGDFEYYSEADDWMINQVGIFIAVYTMPQCIYLIISYYFICKLRKEYLQYPSNQPNASYTSNHLQSQQQLVYAQQKLLIEQNMMIIVQQSQIVEQKKLLERNQQQQQNQRPNIGNTEDFSDESD